MEILKFSFKDNLHHWELEPIEFSDFNLLVGVSGVGKTQILNSIGTVGDIASGTEFNGVSWDITFSVPKEGKYNWTGEFQTLAGEQADGFDADLYGVAKKPIIKSESLKCRNKTIFERNGSKIYLEDTLLPKLNPSESAVSLLRYETKVTPAYEAFNRLLRCETHKTSHNTYLSNLESIAELTKKFNTLKKIQATKFNTLVKLWLLNHCKPKLFETIKNEFTEIFPQVEDVRIDASQQNLEDKTIFTHSLMIKEKQVRGWVEQARISSGMYKTFLQLAQMHLWAKDSVIIIDEFENSLGINCIDTLTDTLMSRIGELQFIVTSHHPYIINNISPDHWKVVQRRYDKVSAKDAKSLGIGRSSHEAFIQLINNEDYTDGIIAE